MKKQELVSFLTDLGVEIRDGKVNKQELLRAIGSTKTTYKDLFEGYAKDAQKSTDGEEPELIAVLREDDNSTEVWFVMHAECGMLQPNQQLEPKSGNYTWHAYPVGSLKPELKSRAEGESCAQGSACYYY